jgi:predicted transcriptional regulator
MLARKPHGKTMKKTLSQTRERLGPLEDRLLRVLWQLGNATVRELMDEGYSDGAYTTIMTTLDRLHKKGLLKREPDGRAFRYSPAQTEQEFNGAIVREALYKMLAKEGTSNTPLSFLVEAITEHDAKLLDELERQIERKRRELDGGK